VIWNCPYPHGDMTSAWATAARDKLQEALPRDSTKRPLEHRADIYAELGRDHVGLKLRGESTTPLLELKIRTNVTTVPHQLTLEQWDKVLAVPLSTACGKIQVDDVRRELGRGEYANDVAEFCNETAQISVNKIRAQASAAGGLMVEATEMTINGFGYRSVCVEGRVEEVVRNVAQHVVVQDVWRYESAKDRGVVRTVGYPNFLRSCCTYQTS
jgi:hypothetical protein